MNDADHLDTRGGGSEYDRVAVDVERAETETKFRAGGCVGSRGASISLR